MYEDVPVNIRESLNRYSAYKTPTGGFLRAVLENNLSEAIGRADRGNQKVLPAICQYIYNELPSVCWGSPVKVKAWLKG